MYDAFAYFCDMLSDESVLFIPFCFFYRLPRALVRCSCSVVEMDKSSLLDVCCMLDGYPISVKNEF